MLQLFSDCTIFLCAFFFQSLVNEIMFIKFYVFSGSQLAKMNILTCPCHKIYRDEAVGLKS